MPVSTTAEKLKPIRKRCAKAYEDSHDWRELTDELNDYTLTHRTGVNRHTGHARSKNRHAAHDATAGKARQRFAGRMSRDVTPPFQKFSEIKLGPASMAKLQEISQSEEQAKGQADELNKVLETVSNQVQGIFERAQFALAAEEMYLDLFAGQGAMLVLEDDDDIVQFVSVPATEIAMREDGRGRVNGIYWRKAITAGNLPGMWKDPQFSSELAKKIKDTPEQMIAIVQAGEFDAASKRWNLFVYEDEKSDDPPIFEELGTLTTAWITPRFYKVPGEAHGRGPGLTALPTIKTLDKVTELTIKAAAFAVLGLWVYRNDRAFNPQTSKMAPGAMWKVRDTSGPQGPSIQKLDVPGRFDVSNLILQDLREQVKQITFDDTLPPDAGAVRSATEIVERLNRLQQDLSGAFARMVLEIVVPLVKRVVDILQRKGLINLGDFDLDQLALKIEVTSPIARAQQAQDISAIVNWLQIMLQTGGPEMMMMAAKIESIFTEIGRKLGVSPQLMRSEAEKQGLQEMVAQIIAQSQLGVASNAGGEGTPPAEPAPAQV